MNPQPEPGDNNSESSCDDGKERSTNAGENDSSSSTNGKGSGSGGGYNGDCSSSDASSSESSSKQKKTAPELSVSVQNMKLNEKRDEHNQEGEENTINNRTKAKSSERRNDKKADDCWTQEDQQYSSWDLASATQVAIQISALAAIIEQNRMMADETPRLDGPLPQWNGIRVSHPMDPRIDLRTVGHFPGSNVPVASSNMMNVEVNSFSHDSVPPPTVDNYMNLMEAVRPYFLSYGFPLPQPPTEPVAPTHSEKGISSDGTNGGTGSSEGFTAFFTTTEKSGSSDSSDRKSNVNNKNADNVKTAKVSSGMSGSPAAVHEQEKTTANAGEKGSQDESDSSSSSMVVLARVKRKHQRRKEKGEWNSNDYSVQPDSNQGSPSHQGKTGVQGGIENEQKEKGPGDSQESSSSSSSSSSRTNPPMPMGQEVRQHFPPQNEGAGEPHIVSETNTASNTSGSGSGGNSGSNSGTNSGSGSNPGSSGSGNENAGSSGSGNEGKGSSDDAVVKGDNSGGDVNAESVAMDVEKVEAQVHDARKTVFVGDEYSQEDETSRENRLLDKKRKRMNMRREYEEQVQQDLDSEDSPEEVDIRPGKPVTLDAVLSFTKIARVVVQATPPFLVVHTNAAFTTLTGIDSHSIVGKPIRGVISVPHSKQGFMLTEIDHTDGSHSGQSSMTNSASGNRQQEGSSAQQDPQGRQLYEGMRTILNHEAAAAAGQARANSNEMQDIDVERLVAASGFGHIHIMNVLAKPHQHHHHLPGRNVSQTREGNRGGDPHLVARPQGEHGSEGSSIPSNDGLFHFLACRMGVSPVVSVTNSLDVPAPPVAMDHENANKRRKHHLHRRHPRGTPLVTHYCIQLEKALVSPPEKRQRANSGSQLSHSNSNRKPAEAEAPADPPQRDVDDENGTESTDPKVPVSAIG